MTRQPIILFTPSSFGGIAGKSQGDDSNPREEGYKRQQCPHAQAQRACAGARRGHVIRRAPRVLICCLNDVGENRSAAGAGAVWQRFAGALGTAAWSHVSRESQWTEWREVGRSVMS